MSNNPNAPVGLRLKQRSVLSFNTPGGMSRAMSQMRVLGTPGGPPGSQSQLSQDPGAPSQPVGSGDGMQSQGMGMMSQGMGMMSQGMPMYTPDFITPVDAQFACNYDPNEKENKGPRSPVHLSPVRSKRPRFGFDPSQLSQDSQLGSQPAGMGLGSQPANWGGASQGLPRTAAPPPARAAKTAEAARTRYSASRRLVRPPAGARPCPAPRSPLRACATPSLASATSRMRRRRTRARTARAPPRSPPCRAFAPTSWTWACSVAAASAMCSR